VGIQFKSLERVCLPQGGGIYPSLALVIVVLDASRIQAPKFEAQ
jgi:hypothetical protein